MHANKDYLHEVDPVTKWPPFVLAALDEKRSCNFTTVFYLLREHPEHAEIFLKNIILIIL